MADRIMRQEKAEDAVAQMPGAVERCISQLIGGLMVFGLALGGLAIGYASTAIRYATTSVLVAVGFVLAVSGLWTLIRR
jgi:hypothetical protein